MAPAPKSTHGCDLMHILRLRGTFHLRQAVGGILRKICRYLDHHSGHIGKVCTRNLWALPHGIWLLSQYQLSSK